MARRATGPEVLFAVVLGTSLVAIVFIGQGGSASSSQPLLQPLARRAGGWTHEARREGSHWHWTLTYRGEPLRATGRLVTPLGTLTGEPSPRGDTGHILDTAHGSRNLPWSGGEISFDALAKGHLPSDCASRPRGMPADWSCRADGPEPGWIAPSILFGSRFRVEDAPAQPESPVATRE